MSDTYKNTCVEQRMRVLAESRLVVIKIGSAVLTDSSSLNHAVLESLAGQIARIRGAAPCEAGGRKEKGHNCFRRVILVSSGAVAAGKAVLRQKGRSEFANYAVARHAIAAIGQSLLMQAWNQAFAPHGILTAQVLLTRDDLRSRARFQTAGNTFAEMLSWGVVPIVNENDTVSVSDLKFGDNDCLASLLVNLAGADLFVNLTSAPGVLDANPEDNSDAKVMDCVESIARLDIDSLCGGKTAAGSGGMHSKLIAARRVAQIGVPTLILPGRMENVLLKAFGLADADAAQPGLTVGTWICPEDKSISRRKFWLAYQSEPQGMVEIDDGAANALLFNGGSLLPGGITEVSGSFAKGALLRISNKGQNLGVGFSNYSSDWLIKIKGLKRHEVAAILGVARYPDVIHRDNLLLDAAI